MARFDTIGVYIITNKRYGTPYTGVTSDLVHRVGQHRAGEGSGFAAKYKCKLLVWYEVLADIRVAIQREKSIKRYSRQWKINLIEAQNPDWLDLWDEIRSAPFRGQRRSIEQVRRGEFPDSCGEP